MEWFWIVAGLGVVAFFAAGCACCGCAIYSYDSQTNTTDLSPDWDEVSGDWETNGDDITTPDANALLLHSQETPSEGGYMITGFFLPSTPWTLGSRGGSDKARVYFNYVDSSNWHCLEFGDVVKLIKKTSGTEAVVFQLDSELSTLPSRICVRDSGLVSWTDSAQLGHAFASYTSLHSGGKKWGLGSGDTNASGVYFSMPAIVRYNGGLVTPTDDQDGNCPGCGVATACQYFGTPLDDDPPQEVQIEIISFPNGTGGTTCPNLEGTYIAEYRGGWAQNVGGYSHWVADVSSAAAEDIKQLVVRSNGNRDGSGKVALIPYKTTAQNLAVSLGSDKARRLEWTIPSAAAICETDTPRTFVAASSGPSACHTTDLEAEVTWLS